MIYLASPYSHPDANVREERFHAACQAAAHLMREGHLVFSPVAHTHSIAQFGLPIAWAFWERHDRCLLECCDEVVVLKLEGWEDSVGVRSEVQIAKELGRSVRYLASERLTLARAAKEKEL